MWFTHWGAGRQRATARTRGRGLKGRDMEGGGSPTAGGSVTRCIAENKQRTARRMTPPRSEAKVTSPYPLIQCDFTSWGDPELTCDPVIWASMRTLLTGDANSWIHSNIILPVYMPQGTMGSIAPKLGSWWSRPLSLSVHWYCRNTLKLIFSFCICDASRGK